jgi:hypothetical protein
MHVLYRVAYAPNPDDAPDRDRIVRDFAGTTGRDARDEAHRWAASRNRLRPPELRAEWPWVLERWNARTRDWEHVSHLR